MPNAALGAAFGDIGNLNEGCSTRVFSQRVESMLPEVEPARPKELGSQATGLGCQGGVFDIRTRMQNGVRCLKIC